MMMYACSPGANRTFSFIFSALERYRFVLCGIIIVCPVDVLVSVHPEILMGEVLL